MLRIMTMGAQSHCVEALAAFILTWSLFPPKRDKASAVPLTLSYHHHLIPTWNHPRTCPLWLSNWSFHP